MQSLQKRSTMIQKWSAKSIDYDGGEPPERMRKSSKNDPKRLRKSIDYDGVEPPKTIQNAPKMIQKSMDSDGVELPNRVQNIKKTSKNILLDSISTQKMLSQGVN